jgi:hypothetical protein
VRRDAAPVTPSFVRRHDGAALSQADVPGTDEQLTAELLGFAG